MTSLLRILLHIKNLTERKKNHTWYEKPMKETPKVGVRPTQWAGTELNGQRKCMWHLVLSSVHCNWGLYSQNNIMPWMSDNVFNRFWLYIVWFINFSSDCFWKWIIEKQLLVRLCHSKNIYHIKWWVPF